MAKLVDYIVLETFYGVASILSILLAASWVYIHCRLYNESTFLKKVDNKLIVSQYISIILFAVCPIVLAQQVLQYFLKYHIYSDSTDQSRSINKTLYSFNESNNYQVVVAQVCYSFGKYFTFIILYLRLKQMLNNSIFKYKPNVYFRVKLILILYLIDILLIGVGFVVQFDLLTVFAFFVWILLDIIYYISVSYLFITKLQEITNTYQKFVLSMSPRGSSITTSNQASEASYTSTFEPKNTANNTNNTVAKTTTSFVIVSPQTSSTNNPDRGGSSLSTVLSHAPAQTAVGGVTAATDANNNNRLVRITSNSTGSSNGTNGNETNTTVGRSNSARMQARVVENKQKMYEIMSKIVKIYTKLSVIILGSSLISFIVMVIFNFTFELYFVGAISICIDCVINITCSLLFFDNARKFYFSKLKCLCCNKI